MSLSAWRLRALAGVIVLVVTIAVGLAMRAAGSGPEMLAPRPPTVTARVAAPFLRPFAGRLLVYGNDAMPASQVRAIAVAARTEVTAVYSREISLASGRPSYPEIPLAAITADPVRYSRAAGVPELAAALRGGAVLARTEAGLRHAGVGSVLRFADGRTLRVSAIVDDHVLGGHELAVPVSSGLVPTLRADYLVVADRGAPAAVSRTIRAAVAAKLRIESSTANGFFSSADSVLTQLQVKARFGEFAMRRTGGAGLVQDPAWVDSQLVSVHVPQLGQVTCHRRVIAALTAAMKEVTARGLGATVHTADFQYEGGCWNPNIVPGAVGTVSRHTWGLAVDINVDTNAFGEPPHQDGRLVAILRRHGFTWGGTWLTPDAMHFEYVGS